MFVFATGFLLGNLNLTCKEKTQELHHNFLNVSTLGHLVVGVLLF